MSGRILPFPVPAGCPEWCRGHRRGDEGLLVHVAVLVDVPGLYVVREAADGDPDGEVVISADQGRGACVETSPAIEVLALFQR